MLKVMILCGGYGRRLENAYPNLPKPLVPFNGKPILQHIIEFYIAKGLNNFVLCTGFNSEAIETFVSTKRFNADIELSNAGKEASILKRIHEARNLIKTRAIITYGDTFININPAVVLDKHDKNNADLTITIADIRSPFGLVKINESDQVIAFDEKPVFSYYIGYMIMERTLLDNINMDLLFLPDGEGLVGLFQELIKAKKINAYKHTGLQITFNTFYERQKAEEEFIRFFTQEER